MDGHNERYTALEMATSRLVDGDIYSSRGKTFVVSRDGELKYMGTDEIVGKILFYHYTVFSYLFKDFLTFFKCFYAGNCG